ncbi:MAG: rhomboid family intramembrane serine protease [Flavobacterium sp.]|nr:rhomboid family intramembrane serine protease [Flavobacterium sp.]
MNFLDELKWQYKSGGFEQKVIYWNVAVFLISLVLFFKFKAGYFDYPSWLALHSDFGTAITRPWTFLTYAFFHANFFHLLFNMIILNFAGRLFITYFTQSQFIGLYILSAIFAGIIFVFSYYLLDLRSTIVGASGAIMAILVATTTYAPMMQLRLLLIGTVRLWQLTAVVVLLDLIYIFADNTGGHIAHLAGAFFGFAYIKLLQNGTDLSKIFTMVSDAVSKRFSKNRVPFTKVHRNSPVTPPKTTSRIVTKDKTQQQIDEILDKISQSGYDSLTKDEKEFLFRAGKQ